MAVSGVGFLKLVSDKVREFTDNPDTDRFSDAMILDFMRRAFADVFDDVNRISPGKIIARFDIALVELTREYLLPANFGQLLAFQKNDEVHGDFEWEVVPRPRLTPWGSGFTIEGNIIRFNSLPQVDKTLQLVYTPRGDSTIFEATTTEAGDVTTTTLKPPASVTEGAVDVQANSYLGYVVHVLSENNGTVQERTITSEDRTIPSRPVLTVSPAFSPALGVSVVFEVVPRFAYRYQDLVALKASRFIASVTSDTARMRLLLGEYQDAMRAMRLAEVNKEQRIGPRFVRATRGRRRWGKTI